MKKWLKIGLIVLLIVLFVIVFVDFSSKDNHVNCLPEQRNVDACIEIYQPVCATVNVQCIKAPCDPVKETYENSCKACSNSLVESYVEGGC